MKTCAWHQCGKRFEPRHHNAKYCCDPCAKAAIEWRRQRGATIVYAMLNCDPDEFDAVMREAFDKLKAEISACTSPYK